jgi:serine protease Do
VRRGRLGVGIQEVNQALAESFGLDVPRGALISSIEQGGPADTAGLEPGDVILEFNGRPIASANELPAAVAAMKPGEQTDLIVWHKGSPRSFDVKVGEMQDEGPVAAVDTKTESGRLGLALRPLSAEERSQADLPSGLLVEEVTGTAAEAGIRPGDVVLSANGKQVDSVKSLRDIVDDARDHVALLVQRGDTRIFIPVELG